MTTLIGSMIFAFVIGYTVGKYLQPKIKQGGYIKQRQMKILFNPFTEKHMWCVFDPKTRTWHWHHEATEKETKEWFSDTEVHVISLEDKTNG